MHVCKLLWWKLLWGPMYVLVYPSGTGHCPCVLTMSSHSMFMQCGIQNAWGMMMIGEISNVLT
jgi:hypothetical protein